MCVHQACTSLLAWLFVLLENACHELDLTAHMQGTEDCGPSYQIYSAVLQWLNELKDEQLGLSTGLQQLEQLLTHGLVTGVFTASSCLLLQALRDAVNKSTVTATCMYTQQELNDLLKAFTHILRKPRQHSLRIPLTKGSEGPFVNGLEHALSYFHVQRQAYYSGNFVGNHVHGALQVHLNLLTPLMNKFSYTVQPSNTHTLCSSVVVTTLPEPRYQGK